MTLKKFNTILVIAVSLLAFQPVRALEITGSNERLIMNHGSQPIGDIVIAMNEADPALTALHGVALTIPFHQFALWEVDVRELRASGSAVQNNKISATVTIGYSADYKTLRIPLLADWVVGESVTLSGLKVRVYDEFSGPQPLSADVSGDGKADLVTGATIYIDSASSLRDSTPTSPPQNVRATIKADPWRVEFTWGRPPDYDFASFKLFRVIQRGQQPIEDWVDSNISALEYYDYSVKEGDIVEYQVYAEDSYRNTSAPVVLKMRIGMGQGAEAMTVTAPQEPTEAAVAPAGGTESAPPVSDSERSLLERLYGYFGIRYQIKCLPSGRAAAEGDSACLWAKIDRLYAQKTLGRPALNFSLSAREKALMSDRLQYSLGRYEASCVNAVTSAPYCAALGRALKRASIFINP